MTFGGFDTIPAGMLYNEVPAEVKIIADSISPDGIRLPTWHARYWRPIHAEVMTHRDFSRNARSSRAVPTVKLLAEDPFMPHFMQNQPGMQALQEMPEPARKLAEKIWYDLARHTQAEVEKLHELGVHKQWANRPLEWFGWIDVLITSTNLQNFWNLRIHSAAQPELQTMAAMMNKALADSTPQLLRPGEWHMPYVHWTRVRDKQLFWTSDAEGKRYSLTLEEALKLSTARCARLSYKPFDGSDKLSDEFARYDRLITDTPPHATPSEHQCTPDRWIEDEDEGHWEQPLLHGNLYGWVQHRKLIPGERALDIRKL